MSLYYLTVFLIKAVFIIPIHQASDNITINLILYQHLVDKLMYLAYNTRPNLAFVVG